MIFERTPTGVTLTPQGERFAAQASGILTQTDQLMQNRSAAGRKTHLRDLGLPGLLLCAGGLCLDGPGP